MWFHSRTGTKHQQKRKNPKTIIHQTVTKFFQNSPSIHLLKYWKITAENYSHTQRKCGNIYHEMMWPQLCLIVPDKIDIYLVYRWYSYELAVWNTSCKWVELSCVSEEMNVRYRCYTPMYTRVEINYTYRYIHTHTQSVSVECYI